MQHFLDVLKIVEGALSSDKNKVVAYAEQLSKKLLEEGDQRSGRALSKLISGSSRGTLAAARLSPQLLPIDSESKLNLADEHQYAAADVPVHLSPMADERISQFVREVESADKLMAHGVGISPTLLMYGPPGCGKTEIGKHIAARLRLPLLTARSDSLISSYLGSTAKNLRLLFEHAMARPCVLFLDEFDALAKLRDDQRELGELKRVVVSLIQNIDAMGSGTVLLAATNHEHLLDRAVWRRFAYTLHVGPPDDQARSAMLNEYLGAAAPEIRHEQLVAAVAGMSGAEIKQLCEDARRRAVLGESQRVPAADFLRRLLGHRLPHLEHMPLDLAIKEVRGLQPKLFTVRRLSELFAISTGKVSALMRESQVTDG